MNMSMVLIYLLGFALTVGATVLVIALPSSLIVFFAAILAFILTGIADYYLGLTISYWLYYAFVFFGTIKWLLWAITKRSQLPGAPKAAYFYLMVAFLTTCIISTFLNNAPILVTLVGFKMYIFTWFLIPAISMTRSFNRLASGAEGLLIMLPFIQLPAVIHQHYFVAPGRAVAGASWDSVVGTFGGDPEGGGSSATLLLFSIISILVVIYMRQAKRVGFVAFAAVTAVSLINIMMGEVKALFIFLPLALLIQQAPELKRHPLRSLSLTAIFGGAMFLTYGYYSENYWAHNTVNKDESQIEQLTNYILDPDNINYETGEVGRAASMSLWYNDPAPLVYKLIGFGAASARVQSTVAIGSVGSRYAPLDVGATTFSQLLWDTGAVGTFLFVSSIIAAFLKALKAGLRSSDKLDRGRLLTFASILAVLLVGTIYNRYLVDHAAEGFLLVFIYGILGRYLYEQSKHRPKTDVWEAKDNLNQDLRVSGNA